jgi:hypothetical protein
MWGMPDDPSWNQHNELMRRHHETRGGIGIPVVTSDERPACSGYSISRIDGMVVSLAVPGLGTLVLRLGEGAADGKLAYLSCRLTKR